MTSNELVGLRGEVFRSADGRVAFAIPPIGKPNAISFEIISVYPAGDGFPSWADLLVNGVKCRINPDICRSLFRLADCVAFAYNNRKQIPTLENNAAATVVMPPAPHPESEAFVFLKAKIGGQHVILIDTAERAGQFEQRPPAAVSDGNHWWGGFRRN